MGYIYKDEKTAKAAMNELSNKIQSLVDEYHATEECGDSCVETWLTCWCYTEDGGEKKYYFYE